MTSDPKPHKYRTVMLVDDSKLDNFILTKMVKLLNFGDRVVAFDNPVMALGYIKDNLDDVVLLPEVVFVDMNMPEMDGFVFIKAFKDLSKSTSYPCKVVMLTSSVKSDHTLFEANQESINWFFSKPISEEMLAVL